MKSTPAALLLSFCLYAHAADLYDLDSGATRVAFDIDRFGLHWISAHFKVFRGAFVFDHEGAASRVDVSVQTESIDCGSSLWNPHLRSPEWLDTLQYPQMVYRSRDIKFEDAGRAEIRGQLTLHGVTNPVVLDVTDLRCPAQASVFATCSFVARANVRRSAFGLPHGFWTGGDQVAITINGVGTRVQ